MTSISAFWRTTLYLVGFVLFFWTVNWTGWTVVLQLQKISVDPWLHITKVWTQAQMMKESIQVLLSSCYALQNATQKFLKFEHHTGISFNMD